MIGQMMPGATPIAAANPRAPRCRHSRPAPSACTDRCCRTTEPHLHSICPVGLPGCPRGTYITRTGVWWPL